MDSKTINNPDQKTLLTYNKQKHFGKSKGISKYYIEDAQNKIPYEKVVYKAVTLGGDSIYFLKPILDKLTLLIDITDEEDQLGLRGVLFNLVKSDNCPHWQSAGKNFYVGKKYAHICQLTPPGTSNFITVSIAPKVETKINHFLKFEMNPDKLGFLGIQFFRQSLEELFMDQYSVDELLFQSRITRYDMSVDILNVSFSDILMVHDFGGKSLMFQDQDGSLETIYGGKKKTFPYSVYLYDKRKQLVDKGYPPKFGNIPHLRLEIRRPKGPVLGKLENCNNPFLKVNLFHKGMFLPSGKKHVWELFMDSCQIRGLEKSKAGLPKELEGIFSKGLEEASTRFWKPKDIWKYWPKTVHDLGFF